MADGTNSMKKETAIPRTVDDYIARFPSAVQVCLQKMRTTIKRAAPGAKETISYGIPTLKLNGPLIYFAGFKAHIGLYPMATTLQRQFKKELSEYLSEKATAKFPLNKPIPYPLIARIVTFRVKENLNKAVRAKS
ncbi:MAG: DUF1801 domain-containing protein [Nitrospira sp.]|jgi:uncharacterized protein YdhG (YjbR/CyaY superfamily)